MTSFVCYLNLLLVVLGLCILQSDATYNTYRHYKKYVRVSFKQSEYWVKESDGRVAVTIQADRRYFYDSFYVKIRASVDSDLKHYASSDDFEESLQTVKFWSRQTAATVYIKIKDDDRVEGTEAFKIEILVPRDLYSRGVQFGNPAKAKVLIKDDDQMVATRPPVMNSPKYGVYVRFSHEEYRVSESDGFVLIKVILSGYRKFPVQVVARSFVPTKFNLPAASGKDFKVGEYKLYFPVKSDVATVKIPIYDDYIVEGTEAFAVNLYIPDYYRDRYVDYGDPFLTKVIIDDDDKHPVTKPPTPPPTVKPVKSIYVQFSQKTYVVDESDGYAVLKVTVSGYRKIPISVNIKIFVSSEFQPTPASTDDVAIGMTRLVFYPSDDAKAVRVKIFDDRLVEGTESFGVKLIVPDHHIANGLKLGNPSLTTVFIKDDDKPVNKPPTKPPATQPPTRPPFKKIGVRVRFQYRSYKIHESCTMLSVTLVVIGKVIKPFTVGIVPMSHHMPSAKAGEDFETGVLKVTFQPGRSYARTCVVIIDDDFKEGYEKFRLVLSIPRSLQAQGVWAAYPYFADVIIADDFTDGMGLPLQLPPTEYERTTICKCKSPPSTEPPPLPQITVSFKSESYPASESDGSIIFTVQASEAPSDEFSVEFSTQNAIQLSAEDGGIDYTATNETVTFLPGETCVSVTVPINDDSIPEKTESFVAVLMTSDATPDHVSIGTPSTAVGLITDNDPLVVQFENDTGSAVESDGSISFTIISLVPSDMPFTVQVYTRESDPRSAGADDDYLSLVQNLTFNDGSGRRTFSVSIRNDMLAEDDEIFEVFLKLIPNSPFNVTIGEPSIATGIIFDDDMPTVSFLTNSSSADESDGSISFTIISSVPSATPFTVQVCTRETIPRSAEADDDYATLVQNITFDSGVISNVFTVTIFNDSLAESDESFEVFLKLHPDSPDVIIGEPSVATGTIFDDEAPIVSFLTGSSSADESDGSISFTIISSVPSATPFIVQVCTREIAPQSAEAGNDYETLVQDITFASGVTSNVFTVTIMDDSIAEGDEAFEVFLKLLPDSTGVTIGQPSVATGIIFDDEMPIIQFLRNASSAVESDGVIDFTLISSAPSDTPFIVQVCTRETNPRSAEADVDYDSLVQNITFPSGVIANVFSVTIFNDTIPESDESFEVFIKLLPSSPGVAIGEQSVATGTIFDDEIPAVRLSSNVSSVRESDEFVLFTLISSFPPEDPFTVQVFTRERNRTSATSGEDFMPVILNVTFDVGETMINITVPIIPDMIVEGDERFYVQLEGFEGEPNTISLPDGAWVTIIDDDMTIRYENIVVTDVESAGRLVFALVTSEPAAESFTVQVCTRELNDTLATGPESDGFATADVDYDSDVINVVFNAGADRVTVAINITDDIEDEGNEVFGLVLKPTNSTPDTVQIIGPSTAFGVIEDNDEPGVRFQSNSSTAPEADEFIQFVVELTIPSDRVITVQVCTEETTPSASAEGNDVDFTDVVQNVTFAIGETTQNVLVPIIRDDIPEADEEFNLVLKNVLGGDTSIDILEPSVSVGIIIDTTPVTVQFAPDTLSLVQNENISPMRFELVLSGPVSGPFDVEVCTRDGSAIGGGIDYTTVSINVTFIAGSTSQFFDVPLINDTVLEPTEEFTVEIKAIHLMEQPVPPVVIGSNTVATGTILDDDAFTVMFNDTGYCGAEEDGIIEVTVIATGTSSLSYNVTITPSELDAVSASEVFDFSNDTIVVTFNPGETEQTVPVVINPDCLREGSENFSLVLSLGSTATGLGITLGDPSEADAEIKDTDIIFVNFTQATYSAEEGDMMMITVEADGFSPWPYSVEINPVEFLPVGASGNAEGNGTDFDSDTLIARFNPGDSQVTVSLPIIADRRFDPDERFSLELTVPDEFRKTNGSLLIKPGSNNVAVGEIIDPSVLVNFSSPSYRAEVNGTAVLIRVMAFGSFNFPFIVTVIPDAVNIPEGEPFFNPDPREVLFPISVTTAIVPIQLFPEAVMDMDLEFIVRLSVPTAAMRQGVILGDPRVSTVTVPATR